MAEMAVLSVASKILSTITSPAFEKAYEKVCSIRAAREELVQLGVTLNTISAVLADAEKKEHDSAAIRNWIKRLKGVLYDAEDLFDEVATDDLLKQQRKKLKHKPPPSTQLDHFNPGASSSSTTTISRQPPSSTNKEHHD